MSAINNLIEYMKIHLISLEQDDERIQKEMDEYENYEDDEYLMLEIEDISNTGKIMATHHLLNYALELERNKNAN